MGAFPLSSSSSSWLPEDDLLLKNSVEAGASLESLSKGAVHFSRRFTFQELQDRWHSLLYDPAVAIEASARMIEFERNASTLPSKSIRFENIKESKCGAEKRKAENLRKSYHAMRKRICNDPFGSMDMGFLGACGDTNFVGNGDEPLSPNYMLGAPISNHFGLEDANFDVMHHAFPEFGNSGGPATSTGVEELCQSKPLPVLNTTSANEVTLCSEFGGQVFNSSVSDCNPSFHNFGYSSPLPQTIWNTIEGACAPTLPEIQSDFHLGEKEQQTGTTFVQPEDVDKNNLGASGYNVVHSDLKLENQTPCDNMENSSPITDDYLTALSNSLLNFTPEELLFMDADGKDTIDKSYLDGLSSLLLDSPNDYGMPNVTLTEPPVASSEYLNIPSCALPEEAEDKVSYPSDDGRLVFSSKATMLPSASAVNPDFPELRDGVICCMLNTEDPEIPSNEDVFLTILMPASSFPSSTQWKFHGDNYSTSSSVKDFSGTSKTKDGGPNLLKRKQNNCEQSHAPSHTTEKQLLPKKCSNLSTKDHRVKIELPNSDVPHVALSNASTGYAGPSQISSANLSTRNLVPNVKGYVTKVEQSKHLNRDPADSNRKNEAHGFDGLDRSLQKNGNGCKQEVAVPATIPEHQALHTDLGSIDITIPEPIVNPSPLEEKDFPSESDDDVPYFSDVEAMILDMDLSPADKDLYSSREVLKNQHEDTKRAIIRLEQAADAHMQRAIAFHDAFAVLYGRHLKHFIKKPEVLIGRATEEVNVDIDLGREGRANNISRRQAIIKMDKDGSFQLKNLGRFSIFLNGKEVAHNQSLSLTSNSLIEVRGMAFAFETNQTCVKQYVNNITQGS